MTATIDLAELALRLRQVEHARAEAQAHAYPGLHAEVHAIRAALADTEADTTPSTPS